VPGVCTSGSSPTAAIAIKQLQTSTLIRLHLRVAAVDNTRNQSAMLDGSGVHCVRTSCDDTAQAAWCRSWRNAAVKGNALVGHHSGDGKQEKNGQDADDDNKSDQHGAAAAEAVNQRHGGNIIDLIPGLAEDLHEKTIQGLTQQPAGSRECVIRKTKPAIIIKTSDMYARTESVQAAFEGVQTSPTSSSMNGRLFATIRQ